MSAIHTSAASVLAQGKRSDERQRIKSLNLALRKLEEDFTDVSFAAPQWDPRDFHEHLVIATEPGRVDQAGPLGWFKYDAGAIFDYDYAVEHGVKFRELEPGEEFIHDRG